jgi:hypothetical protein
MTFPRGIGDYFLVMRNFIMVLDLFNLQDYLYTVEVSVYYP